METAKTSVLVVAMGGGVLGITAVGSQQWGLRIWGKSKGGYNIGGMIMGV